MFVSLQWFTTLRNTVRESVISAASWVQIRAAMKKNGNQMKSEEELSLYVYTYVCSTPLVTRLTCTLLVSLHSHLSIFMPDYLWDYILFTLTRSKTNKIKQKFTYQKSIFIKWIPRFVVCIKCSTDVLHNWWHLNLQIGSCISGYLSVSTQSSHYTIHHHMYALISNSIHSLSKFLEQCIHAKI